MAQEPVVQPDLQQEETSQTEEFLKYWRSLFNHRWLVLTLTLAALTYACIKYYKMPDYFVASTRIMVHKLNDMQASPYVEMVGPQSSDPTYYETQVEIVSGLPVCRKTAQTLNLSEHYSVPNNEIAAQILQSKIGSFLIRNTRIIVVSVTDANPEWAAKITNEIANAYIGEARRDRMFVSDQILEWFPDKKLLRNSTPDELLDKIDDEDVISKLPTVIFNPTINRLKEEKIDLEAKIRELMTRYTPEHPQIKEFSGRLEYINAEIKLQTNKVISALKASLEGELNVSNIKILERASPPGGPAGPNRKKGILILTFMGFAAGFGLALLIDSLDRTIKSDEDILGIPGVPFLGAVPLRSQKKKQVTAYDLLGDQAVTDSMNTLNTALLFSMPKGQNKFIMLTSSIPEEGKTTLSFLLAATMSKLGTSVLLVEMDLRKPSLHAKLNIRSEGTKGMSDYLVGQATLDEIILKSDVVPGLSIILAGGSSPNPVTLITSSALDEFLAAVTDRYDRIIFDTPPSLQIPDPVVLSNKMHGVVYVIGSGMVHKKLALKTIRKYRFVGSTIFGSILNRVNLRKEGYGTYGRYYGKYYGHKIKPSA